MLFCGAIILQKMKIQEKIVILYLMLVDVILYLRVFFFQELEAAERAEAAQQQSEELIMPSMKPMLQSTPRG